MWQEYNPTFGRWNTTLSKTYRSPDYVTTWLSPFHRFGPFSGEGRLVVKFTGVRDDLIDLNHTQVVANCPGFTGTPSPTPAGIRASDAGVGQRGAAGCAGRGRVRRAVHLAGRGLLVEGG